MDAQNTADTLEALGRMNFDDASKKEIQTVLVQTQKQAQAHSSILAFTSMCWDKCITGTPGSRFARSEEVCLSNCVERFLDTTEYLVSQVQQHRAQNA